MKTFQAGLKKKNPSLQSIDSTGKINGYIEDDLITFMKTYPIKYTIRNDDVIEIPKGQQLVNHTGCLDREHMTM